MENSPACRNRAFRPSTGTLRSRSRFMVLALLILTTSALAASSNQIEIPFENSRVFGLFLVKVLANDRPALLIVDTGSNMTILSQDLMDVAPGTFKPGGLPSKGSGFSGKGIFRKTTLKVGSVTWHDHTVLVTNVDELSKSLGQRVDGMLGIDFFSQFGLVVVDLKNHKLVLDAEKVR
jgi:hypothetical protein